jgi:Zn-finger nucleic acid-binding protein
LDSGVRDAVEIASCSRGHGLWLQSAALEKLLARVPESELTRWFRALLRS